MVRRIASMFGVLALAACSQANEANLSRLRPGVTTVAEAKSILGSPDRDEVLGDGSRMLTYMESSAHTRPANFIPAAGYVWGGWNVRSHEAGLMFDRDGRLRFWTLSGSERPQIKVVGKDAVPHVVSDLPPQNEAPLPADGKGGYSQAN